MYHPAIISARLSTLESAYRFRAQPSPLAVVDDFLSRLSTAWDQKGAPLRPLTPEEQHFTINELLLCTSSYAYWRERYAWINTAGNELIRPNPPREDQTMFLQELGRLEYEISEGRRNDGILVNVLKARQKGISTETQLMQCHRTCTRPTTFGLIAADVPDQSSYIFGMFLRCFDHQPWFLRPRITQHSRTYPQQLQLSSGSWIWSGSGQSKRGTEGTRGQLNRGKTVGQFALTELSTWEDTDQLEHSFFPGIPISPEVFGVCESTAHGTDNWWHQHWEASKTGVGRFTPIFLPWYADQTLYTLIPPVTWSPTSESEAYARRIRETSRRWMHREVTLTKGQLYWYEIQRAAARAKGVLNNFIENYPADDIEAFQFSGTTAISTSTIETAQAQARQLLGVIEIASAADLQKRQAGWEMTPPPENFELLLRDKPTAEDLARLPLLIPRGWGMRGLSPVERRELTKLTDLLHHLLVWELPRRTERYVVSVDVSEGLGLEHDRSVIEVTRVGTLEEVNEQVAQFSSPFVDPTDLAAYVDVIGRFYSGKDRGGALVAIEVNGPGIVTQNELRAHFGYDNLFIWQYLDKADPEKRFTNTIGWRTTPSTRPAIITQYLKWIASRDPLSGISDIYRVNSPLTIREWRTFRAAPGYPAWASEAVGRGNHDDTILAGAIGVFVIGTLHYDEREPVDVARRRMIEQEHRRGAREVALAERRDYANTDYTTSELEALWQPGTRAGLTALENTGPGIWETDWRQRLGQESPEDLPEGWGLPPEYDPDLVAYVGVLPHEELMRRLTQGQWDRE